MAEQTLEWHRDKGRGQEAADAVKAEQYFQIWPMAKIHVTDENREGTWLDLLRKFNVNAVFVTRGS